MYFHFSCLKNHELHIFAAWLYNGGECCTSHRPDDIPRTVVFLLPQHKALMISCISVFFTSSAKVAILNVNSFSNFIFSNSNFFSSISISWSFTALMTSSRDWLVTFKQYPWSSFFPFPLSLSASAMKRCTLKEEME